MHHHLLQDIATCIVAAWIFGVLANFFKQPVILAYLVGGFLLGPSGLQMVSSEESIHTISELGLIFLLFMIGLEIDLKQIVRAGQSITMTGLVQLLVGCLAGVGVFKLLGYELGGGKFDALYLAVAAALSSTVIIVKILYDKRELDTLPGRVTLGILVLQDLFAILFLAVQPNLADLRMTILGVSLVRVCVLVATTLLVSRFILPYIFHHVARLPELVLVGAIAWCFLVGEFGAYLKLSREMGALVAGVSLSTFPYALDVTAKVTSLRDFFVTLFFVGLGMTIPLPDMPLLIGAVIFGAFVVVTRIITVFSPLYGMRQGLRASLLPAINLCQISEFSLVVLQLGVVSGHISAQSKGVASLAFVLLATISALAMTKSDTIVRRMIPVLKRCGLKDLDHAHDDPEESGHGAGSRIYLLGFFRTASSLLVEIGRQDELLLEQVTVIDFNPRVHADLRKRGVKVVYGDISQRDTLMHAGITKAEIIICSVPDSLLKGTSTERLVRQVRALAPEARIIATAEMLTEVTELYRAGANYVSLGRLEEARDICDAIRAIDDGLLEDKRSQLDTRLAERNEVLH